MGRPLLPRILYRTISISVLVDRNLLVYNDGLLGLLPIFLSSSLEYKGRARMLPVWSVSLLSNPTILSLQELLSEHKATRVLAVVFICFFFCWTPFFIANFIFGFCGQVSTCSETHPTVILESCEPPVAISTLFLWLGYVSSTINPLIYTVFNKRFRKVAYIVMCANNNIIQAFIRILRGRCFRKRSTDNTYVGPNSHWSRTHTIMPDACT